MANASILLVDDENDVRELLTTVLSRHSFDIYAADSGTAALKAIEERTFDVVLLDLIIPDVSGLEVLARIRARYSPETLPVVILTGHASNEHIANALEIGANDFLVKPLSLPLIASRIEAQVQSKRAFAELRDAASQARATLNAIPDLIFRADISGRVLDTTPGRNTHADWITAVHSGSHLSGTIPAPMERAFTDFVSACPDEGVIKCTRCQVPSPEGASTVYELRLVACSQKQAVCIVRDVTEQARFEHELLQLARTDALTQIPNRRQLDEVMLTEFRRAQRQGTPLSILLVDIDFFKLYNDSLGHQAGDQCLRCVAQAISEALLRAGDFLARYGGEEFGVVVPNTDDGGGVKVAERIRSTVEALKIPHPQAPSGVVTVSVGLASCLPTKAHLLPTLLRLADEALYEAKKNGRNRFASRTYTSEILSEEE